MWRWTLLILLSVTGFLFIFLNIKVEARTPNPPVFPSSPHYPPICYLPPESGLCNPRQTDEEKRRNKPTSSYKEAMQKKVTLKSKQVWSLDQDERSSGPFESGISSLELLTRYYFDPATEQCYPFGAQNCGGNENRFETRVECQERCHLIFTPQQHKQD